MVHLFFSKLQSDWPAEVFDQHLKELPPALVKGLTEKKVLKDRELSTAGKLLLKKQLETLRPEHSRNFEQLLYGEFGKPYLPSSDLRFNIAHSNDLVVCAATFNAEIGVDIEQVRPVDFRDFHDYFVSDEWEEINREPDRHAGFFKLWTKKESFIKAIGAGMHIPLQSINTTRPLIYKRKQFFIHPVNIATGYECHVASESKQSGFLTREVFF